MLKLILNTKIWKTLGALVLTCVLSSTFFISVGCNSAPQDPTDRLSLPAGWDPNPNVLFEDNPSISSDFGRNAYEPLVRAVNKRLHEQSKVAFRRDGVPLEPGMSNMTPKEARGAIATFAQGTVEIGSDPKKALEESRDLLLSSEGATHRRLILIAHDDMRPDKKGAGDPADVDWSGAKAIDVVIVGVAPELKSKLLKAWSGKTRSLHIYSTDDRIQVRDILAYLPLPEEGFGL